MAQENIGIDPQLWNEFSDAATKQGKKPRTLLAKLIRNYLEIQADQALFAEMRRDARRREMSDAEVVEFVGQSRREQRMAGSSRRSG